MSCVQKGAVMKEDNIRKYAELMSEFALSAIEITEDGSVIRLERETAVSAPAAVMPVMQVAAAGAPPDEPAAGAQPSSAVSASASDADIITVTSPMVGVFYAAPTEAAEHFVSVGARVKKGDTLCIIEAMKLMNEITAEDDGIISEICVTNGQVVDYGCDLFKIKRL